MKSALHDLVVSGDGLAAAGDLAALIHVVAAIEADAAGFEPAELAEARDAVRRWQDLAIDRRAVLTGMLSGRRLQRDALRTYRDARAA